ncbi:DUF4365 domain-containing protein [Arthrobacter sp. YD2]|uniref:DUF4365 domain-containing protein n=1 Tax=Arthrobacter sp. YD2 TaxID=3058046 RepID=UPI0033B7E971
MSHTVPQGSIPKSAMQEQVSRAYIHMVASAAGLTVGTWGTDYDGIDVTLRSKVDFGGLVGSLGSELDIQLKCTGQKTTVRPNTIAWSLDKRTAELLADPRRYTMGVFCVMVVPPDPGHWLHHSVEGLLARSHMYWIRGRDIPSPGTNQSVTVHLPKSNILRPQDVLDLMQESSKMRAVAFQ